MIPFDGAQPQPELPLPETPEDEGTAAPGKTEAKPLGRWGRFKAATHRKADISWRFTKELFNDHTFWVKALAVKGGASAIVISGIVIATTLVNMPILVAIAGITLGVGLVGAGLYGIAAGSLKAWQGLQDVYARTTGKAPKEHVYKEGKDFIQRIAETKLMKNIAQKGWAKKIASSHAWKTTMKFTRRSEDSMLGGIAVGGAALSLAVGLVALPVVAVSTAVTLAAVMTVSTLISGMTGLYFSITGIKEERKLKREHAAKKAALAKKPRRFLPWPLLGGVKANPSPAPGGEVAILEPVGHPFILLPAPVPVPAPAPLQEGAQPLAAAFDPAATVAAGECSPLHKPPAAAPEGPKPPAK